MLRQPPRFNRTHSLLPIQTLFRSNRKPEGKAPEPHAVIVDLAARRPLALDPGGGAAGHLVDQMGPQEVIGDQAAGDDAAQDDESVAHDAGIAGGFAASHGRPGLQRGPRRLVTAAGSADSGKNHTARQLWSAANPSSPAVFSMHVSAPPRP